MAQVVTLLNKKDIPEFWPHIKDMLQDALVKSKLIERYTRNQLYKDLCDGSYAVIIVTDGSNHIDGICVIEYTVYPLGNALLMLLIGGNSIGEWFSSLDDFLIDYSKKYNISWIDACTSEGLGKKYLRHNNYNQNVAYYSKEVI